MAIYELRRELRVPLPLPVVFDFFASAENLGKITPQSLHFHLLTPLPIEMKEGTNIRYSLRVHGLRSHWLTQIERWNPPFEFVDVQVKGPYALWRHTHRFSSVEDGTMIEDVVQYALPFGLLGRLVRRLVVERDLARIFEYRARRVQELLA